MKTRQLALTDDERAMADLADVPDWKRVWGPPAAGPDAVRALAERVSAATGWYPCPLTDETRIDQDQSVWGLVTRRDTAMLVLADAVLPDSPRSGWSAYEIGAGDLAEAAAGLDAHWPAHLKLAPRQFGAPAFVGRGGDPRIPEIWRDRRRHLAVWLRPGAEIHLYAAQPAADSITGTAGISLSVYANGAS